MISDYGDGDDEFNVIIIHRDVIVDIILIMVLLTFNYRFTSFQPLKKLQVKNIRGLTFYDIVSVDHLLHRLAEDAAHPALCVTMTELLLNSFFPEDVGEGLHIETERVRRCFELTQRNQKAAVAFYRCIYKFVSVGDVVTFASMLFAFFTKHMRDKRSRQDIENDEGGEARSATDTGMKFEASLKVGFLLVMEACLSSISRKALARDDEATELLSKIFTPSSVQNVFHYLAVDASPVSRTAASDDSVQGDRWIMRTQAIPVFLKIVSRVRGMVSTKVEILSPETILDTYLAAQATAVSAASLAIARPVTAGPTVEVPTMRFENADQNYAIATVSTLLSFNEQVLK